MKTRLIIGMALLMAVASSCKKKENQDTSSFSASIEVNDSRTYLDGMKVKWTAGDQIEVYGNGDHKTYTLSSGATYQTATFTTTGGVQPTNTYRAFYPADNCTGVSGDVFTFTMPATQTYTANGFMTNLNPMAAKNEGGGATLLKFKNAFSVLKVSATGNRTVTKVVLTVPSGNYVSGTYTFDYSTGNTTRTSDGGNTLELTCDGNGVALDASTPTYFYFVLPPGTLPAGSTIAFYKSGSNTPFYTSGATTTAQTLERNHIHTVTLNAQEAEKYVTNLLPELTSDFAGWSIEGNPGGGQPSIAITHITYTNDHYTNEATHPSGTYSYLLTNPNNVVECFVKSSSAIPYTQGHVYYVRWMSRKEKWTINGGATWSSDNMKCFSQDVFWPADANHQWVNSYAGVNNAGYLWEQNSAVFTHTSTGSNFIRFDFNNRFNNTNFVFYFFCFADAMLIDLTACYADQGYDIPSIDELDSKPYFFGQTVITDTDIHGTSW